jgi:hypothetical protein
MPPKKPRSTPAVEPPKKKSKKEEQAQELALFQEAEKKKAEQRLLAATCSGPRATLEQKAMHEAYKKAGRFTAEKEELLHKFLKDKKCSWYQCLEQEKSETHVNRNSGLKGYGTRPTSKFTLSVPAVCFVLQSYFIRRPP